MRVLQVELLCLFSLMYPAGRVLRAQYFNKNCVEKTLEKRGLARMV